jgi:hypothetical protein
MIPSSGPSGDTTRFSKLSKYANSNLLLIILLSFCVIRIWLMALPSSFWVDEMATVFVARYGAAHPSLTVAPQLPASLYYWLPRLSDHLFGISEIGYRLPSVLAMGIALWLISRLGSRLIHPDAGWFVVAACLALRPINYFAIDARPYALGICIAAAALWFLVRWLDAAAWRDGLFFAVFAALIWWVHLVYWPFYVLLAIYALIRLLLRETKAGWGRAAAVFFLIGLMLLPLLIESINVFREAHRHVVVPPPTVRDFINSMQFRNVLLCGIGAFILSVAFWRRYEWRNVSGSSWALIAGWWLCQPVGLFAFSCFTGNSIFINRYLSLSMPAVALATAAVVSFFMPGRYWKPAALILAVSVLWMKSDWRHFWPSHDANWRDTAQAINQSVGVSETPVICLSPFVEGQWPNWQPDYPLPGFLYSQLSTYPIHGQVCLFPLSKSPESEQYAESLLRTTIPAAGRFIIYGELKNVTRWRPWLISRPELANWNNRDLGTFEGVGALLFESTQSKYFSPKSSE